MRRIFIFATASAVLALLCLPGIAHAGPQVIESAPAQGQTFHSPEEVPSEATITFDLILDAEASELIIRDECGNRVDGDDLRIEANKMTISIAKTPSGYYDMVYNATAPAGVTGSTKGRITFLVHGGSTCGPGAGGHSGHGGHGGNGEPGNSGGHDGHGSGDGGSHDGHEGETGSHDSDHMDSHSSDTTHSHISTDNSTHAMSDTSHEPSSKDHKHHGTSEETKDADPKVAVPIAAPEVISFNLTRVSGGSLLFALLLCLGLGVGGGYLIRQKDAL